LSPFKQTGGTNRIFWKSFGAVTLIRNFGFLEACFPKLKILDIVQILLPHGHVEIEIRLNLLSMPQPIQAAI
jgi:hypothetical protein